MGNEYNRFLQQKLHLHSRNTFLPTLCSKPSIKDVTIPKWEDRCVSFSNDPLSPRISCMGQVKRNNKLNQNTRHSTNNIINNNNNSVKYSKLKKMFSSKNLPTTMSTTTTASCGSRRQVSTNGSNENRTCISIVDMDPPLPVIKKEQKPQGEEAESLWKRRSGGVALKTLQLQQVHHPRHHLQPTTV
ncbi:hypothetical protein CFP56_021207 [Quercus suber]|uniref:Uncharacterized protein n=1 Tax=Quercus suber TaxID=58331 RepID=A0AAW0KFG4_QUESU